MKEYTTHVESPTIKRMQYVLINENPCKIHSCAFAQTGKHAIRKVYLTGIDIFTGKEHSLIQPASNLLFQPIVERKVYKLDEFLEEEESYFVKVSNNEEERKEFIIPNDEILKQVKELINNNHSNQDHLSEIKVHTICAMGIEQVTKVEN